MVLKNSAMKINSKKIGFKAISRSCGVMDKALKVRAPVRETYNFFSLILFFSKASLLSHASFFEKPLMVFH